MHLFLTACATTILAAGLSSQTLLGPKPSAVQHVTAETGTTPAADKGTGRSGGGAVNDGGRRITIHVDVTPKANVQVYAPGAKEFTAISLVLTAPPGIAAGKPVYPASHPAPVPALAGQDDAPVYRRTFRITQGIAVPPTDEDVVVAGVLNYQACDDRVCYPVAALPVSWTIHAR